MDYSENVRRGMALLDAKVPGWRAKIDTAELQMEHCHQCVMGQTFGSYYWGLWKMGMTTGDTFTADYHRISCEYGFHAGFETPSGSWKVLRDEWVRQLSLPISPETGGV